MVLENEIKSAWETAVSLTRTERGTFLAIMAVALICIIFLVVYFLSSINWIVAESERCWVCRSDLRNQKLRETY